MTMHTRDSIGCADGCRDGCVRSRPSACTATVKNDSGATAPAAAARGAAGHAGGRPGAEPFQALVDDAHARFAGVSDGKNADYIPILATIPSELFGVGDRDPRRPRLHGRRRRLPLLDPVGLEAVHGGARDAAVRRARDHRREDRRRADRVAVQLQARARDLQGALGEPAGERRRDRRRQPGEGEEREGPLGEGARQPRGLRRQQKLPLLEKVYDSEYSTAFGNRGIANLLFNWERLYSEPEEALRVYTKQCSVGINTVDLALMGATLANGGVNPKTGKRMLDESSVPELLAIMMTAGFYDESGRWSFDAGLPAKTGVGGGIVAVVPGRFAIAAFSPRLNEAGNSVRAQQAIRYIAGKLGVGVFGPNGE